MRIYIADAFTRKPYTGNPAGVCILPSPKSEAWMQAVAAEMNAPETAFLAPRPDGYSLRWFAPATEVDLCGHGTLASAHILWETGAVMDDEICFHTKSGLLIASKRGELIELDFPAESAQEASVPPALIESLGIDFLFVGRNRMDYIVEVESVDALLALSPDFARLKEVETRGVIVTALADETGVDFVSRFFCPAIGVNEDPVTGSAHCCLAPYWSEKLSKTVMFAKQLSKRGGQIEAALFGERVLLRGQAVTTLSGELAAE